MLALLQAEVLSNGREGGGDDGFILASLYAEVV